MCRMIQSEGNNVIENNCRWEMPAKAPGSHTYSDEVPSNEDFTYQHPKLSQLR